ncbi:DUF1990 family protein [Mycolicibacterium komossense]|uniref:DUF1990 domain-containing protein n=1 Tax=Mycolicibacterium komossense TaxID=1779 RepID=A0ABT3CH67_9MYCO|nr:DUF1990 domain-containing protein [Mycolicibacterium komossense]MCV7228776.1 DUF1990 domain-containing protein [Mycolicibacterium komossense]
MKLSDLAGLPLTYAEVGATNSLGVDDVGRTQGYHHTRVAARIGSGRACFEEAADAVMRYGMLRGAGVRVQASTEIAEIGTLVLGRLGPIWAPCRVVYVLDEPNRRGFAYGTLPGHAETGEEFFGVRYDPASESVYAEVSAFSRPNTWWSKAGAPVAALVQRIVTNRYLRAL